MKEYYTLCVELYTIKVHILKTLMAGKGPRPVLIAETGKQLRGDLDQLKQELFNNTPLSAVDRKELQKIDEKIMLRYAALKRRFEKYAA